MNPTTFFQFFPPPIFDENIPEIRSFHFSTLYLQSTPLMPNAYIPPPSNTKPNLCLHECGPFINGGAGQEVEVGAVTVKSHLPLDV